MLVIIWGVLLIFGIIGLLVGKGIRLLLILIFIGFVGCYGVILISGVLFFLWMRVYFKVNNVMMLIVL